MTRLVPITSILQFTAVGRCRNRPGQFFFELDVVENPRFAAGIGSFNGVSRSFRDLSISGFGSHFSYS